MSAGLLPSYAYIPGKTPRHAEGFFDAIRATAQPDMGQATLLRSRAFTAGLAYLQAGYNWEAHEVLEPVWLALPAGSAARGFVQGVIQLANARLKLEMGRPRAAVRLCAITRGHWQGDAVQGLGDDLPSAWLLELLADAENRAAREMQNVQNNATNTDARADIPRKPAN
jgi:hypothetical protein